MKKEIFLNDIINISIEGTSSILIELLCKYKKSLQIYFTRYYTSEPVLIVTDVFNAAQYGFIAPANEMYEAVNNYIEANNGDDTEEEKEGYRETIMFNSIMLNKL